MPSSAFGTTETVTLGRISDNSRVVSVLVEVLTPLTGYAGGPTNQVPALEVACTQADPSRFMTEDQNDIGILFIYYNSRLSLPGASELEIKVALSHLNATAGEVKVTVTYV